MVVRSVVTKSLHCFRPVGFMSRCGILNTGWRLRKSEQERQRERERNRDRRRKGDREREREGGRRRWLNREIGRER